MDTCAGESDDPFVGDDAEVSEDADAPSDGVGCAGEALTELLDVGDGAAAGPSGPEQAIRVSIVALAAVIASGLPRRLIEMVMEVSQSEVQSSIRR